MQNKKMHVERSIHRFALACRDLALRGSIDDPGCDDIEYQHKTARELLWEAIESYAK